MRWLWLLIFVLPSCSPPAQKEAATLAIVDDVSLNMPSTMSFKKIPITDKQTELTALTCIVPEGWNVQSNSWWIKSDYIEPFKYGLTASDTDTVNQIKIYPTLSYFTSSEISTTKSNTTQPLELMWSMSLPNTAVEAIKDFLIPLYHPDLHDFRIKESVPLSSLDETDENDLIRNKETGMVRVQYVINGNVVEEVFFATLSKAFTPLDKYNTQCRWHIENAVSCRYYSGYMNEQLEVLQTLTCSLQYGFKWLLKYKDALRQLHELHSDSLSTKVFADLVAQSKTDPSEAANIYQNYQRRIWRVTQAYNRYQPMLQSYVDNSGEYVQLPKDFIIAWKNDDDQYMLSDSSSFKPSSGSSTWYELKPDESSQERFPMISASVTFH